MKKYLFILCLFVSLGYKNAYSQFAPYPTVPIDTIQFVSNSKMTGAFPNDSSDYVNPVFKNATYTDSVKFEGYVLFDPRFYGLSVSRKAAILISDTFSKPWGGIEIMCEPVGSGRTLPQLINDNKFYDNLKPGTRVRITGVMKSFRGIAPAGTRQGQSQVNFLKANQNWDNSVVVLDSKQRTFTPITLSIDTFMTGNASVGQVQNKLSGEKWEGTYVELKNVSVYTRVASGSRWFWSVVNQNGNSIDIGDFSGWYRNDATTDSVLPSGRFTPPPIGTNIKFLKGVITENVIGGQYRYTLSPLLPSDMGDTGVTNCSISYGGLADTTVVFKQDSVLINAGNGFSRYEWNTGDTSQSIWVKSNCFLNVTVFDSAGCRGMDSTRVIFVKGMQQKDTTLCLGDKMVLSLPNLGYVPLNGLIAWYPFIGNSNDLSGNGNNGINYGANLAVDRFGNPNNSYKFNGNSSRVLVNSSGILSPTSWSGITMSFWMKQPINANGQPIDLRATNQNDLAVYITNGNANSNNYSGSLGTSIWSGSTSVMSNSNWHLITVTQDYIFKTFITYIDGKQEGFTFSTGLNSLPTPYLNIGSRSSSAGVSNFFTGYLDDVGLWNRSLSSTEVQALFNVGDANSKVSWSTGDTSRSINISPITRTTYHCFQRIGSFVFDDSITVNINPLPIINTLQDTTIAFKQDSILLNVGSGYSKYLWNGGDTTQNKWIKSSGLNKVRVFNSYGCFNSDSTNVLFVKGILNKDSSICKNSNVTAIANNEANENYLWSTGDSTNIILKTITNDIVLKCNYKIGSFLLQDSVRFLVRNLPINTVSYEKKGLCLKDTIVLNASNGYFYNWYKNNTELFETNKAYLAYTFGQYHLKVTDSAGCVNFSDNILIFNAPLPKAKISVNDTALCLIGNLFNFIDSSVIDSGSIVRNWIFGNGNTSTLASASQSYQMVGNYFVRLKETSNYGCIDSATKNITIFPNPTAGPIVGPTVSLIAATPYFYSVAQQLNHNYNWIPTNGIISTGQGTNNATIQWLANGKGYLKVDVINSQGCKDTSSINVAIGASGLSSISVENDLFIYPNPAKNEIKLSSSNHTLFGSQVVISDITGRVVYNDFIRLNTNLFPIDMSNFNVGVFMLTIQKNGATTRLKFVKE